MLTVIFVFSEDYIVKFISFIESSLPFLKNTLTTMLEKQRKLLNDPSNFEEVRKQLYLLLIKGRETPIRKNVGLLHHIHDYILPHLHCKLTCGSVCGGYGKT